MLKSGGASPLKTGGAFNLPLRAPSTLKTGGGLTPKNWGGHLPLRAPHPKNWGAEPPRAPPSVTPLD